MSSEKLSEKLQPKPSKTLKIKQTNAPKIFSIKAFFRAYIGAIKSKALFFTYPSLTSKAIYEVLSSLEKNNRISGYKFFPQKQNMQVFLSYDLTQSKPLVPKVTYYCSQGRTRSVNFKKLQQFQAQNPNSFTLIGTNRGIMDLKGCVFHKCGGEFLVSLS